MPIATPGHNAALLAALIAAAAAPAAELEHFRSENLRKLDLPFSDAVIVGDLIFLSGQIGNLPGEPKLAPGGIVAEARRTMDNIGAVLEATGSSFEKVVKCTVMLADIAEWPAFNDVYATYFTPPYPARSAFAASGLALGARVEVECVARR